MPTLILSESPIDSNHGINHQGYQFYARQISQSFIKIYEENIFLNYII